MTPVFRILLLPCVLLWLLVKLNSAIEAIGFSAQLKDKLDLDVPKEMSGSHSIGNWSIESEYGFYNYDMYKKNEEYYIKVPVEGVYYLSANVGFKNDMGQQNSITMYFEEFSVPNIKKHCTTAEKLQYNRQTVTISCFVRLRFLTILKLSLTNDKAVTVLTGTTISVQFMGSSGITPSLVLPLSNKKEQEGIKSINEGEMDFRYVNTLAVLEKEDVVTIPCSGVYIVSLSVSLAGDITEYSSLELIVNGKAVFKISFSKNTKTHKKHFLQVFNLQKDDEIKIMHAHMEFQNSSTYAIIRTWDDNSKDRIRNLPLTEYQATTDKNTKLVKFPLAQSTHKNKTLEKYLTFTSYGLYIISLDLILSGSDIDVKMIVTQDTEFEDTFGLNSYLTSSSSNYNEKKFSIAGVLEVQESSYLFILLKSKYGKISIQDGSVVTITQVQLNSLIGTFSMTPSKGLICDNNYLQYDNNLDDDFLLNKYLSNSKVIFTAPDNGVYLVHVTSTIELTRKKIENITLHLNHEREGKTLSVYTEYIFPQILPTQVFVTKLVVLLKGDVVRTVTSCAKNVKFLDPVKVDIIFMQSLPAINFVSNTESFDVKKGNLITNYSQKSYTMKQSGIYFVIFKVLLEIDNLDRFVRIQIDVKNQDTVLLVEKRDLDPSQMETTGYVTIQTFGTLSMSEGESIRTKISSEISLKEREAEKDSAQFMLRVLKQRFDYVPMTSPKRLTYGFRGVQTASKLFDFTNDFTTSDFPLTSSVGGFKLTGTRLFGPQFIVSRPMTVFYTAFVNLTNVIGSFKLYVRRRPRHGLQPITSFIRAKAIKTLTLKASGILKLDIGESVELVIYGKTTYNLVVCTRQVWSLMEITTPNPKNYGIAFQKQKQSKISSAEIPKKGTVLFLSRSINPTQNKLQTTPFTEGNQEYYTIQNTDQMRSISVILPYNETEINVTRNENSCHVVLIDVSQLPNPIEIEVTRTVRMKTEDKNMLLLCVKSPEDIFLSKLSDQHKNNTVLKYINMPVNMESFSAIMTNSVEIDVIKERPERLNGWMSTVPTFFNNARGFREGRGMYVVSENGFYLIMISLEIDSKKSCYLHVQNDNINKASIAMKAKTIIYNDVIWLHKNSVLQLMVRCARDEKINIKSSSMFSVTVVDSRVSLPMTCLESSLVINDNSTVYKQVETLYEVTCHHSQHLFGDFYWKRDGQVIVTVKGENKAILKFSSLTIEDTGVYECVMERANEEYKDEINIVVIDPRPHIHLSNSLVRIEEGIISNPMVVWVQVKAFNLVNNKIAPVRLKIIKGNEDDLFYFDPNVTLFISTLKLQKPLDYERAKFHNITIKAENTEYDDQLGVVTKRLDIVVVNRNERLNSGKMFERNFYSINLAENTNLGARVLQMETATYSTIKFSLKQISANQPTTKPYFAITQNATILITREIDYELFTTVHLVVSACLKGICDLCHVVVNIKDMNDNHPIFERSLYELNVSKDEEDGSMIAVIKATDRDSGDNGRIFYRIKNINKYFSINMNTGELFLSESLNQTDTQYEFEVEAYDYGSPSLASHCKVVVTVGHMKSYLSSNHNDGDRESKLSKYLDWRAAVVFALLVVVVFLVVAVIMISIQSNKTAEKLKKQKIAEPKTEMKSLIMYCGGPAEEIEATMKFSHESLPSLQNGSVSKIN